MPSFQLRTTRNSLHAGAVDNNPTHNLNLQSVSTPSTPTPMASAQPESHHTVSDPGQTPGPNPDHTPDEAPTQPPTSKEAFVKAVDTIVKANMPSKVKLWEPDPFDGSNFQQLCTFLLQCKLNFQDHPDLFKDDSTKVNYVLSYLTGSALDCFEPTLLDSEEPAWLSDFTLFVQELEDNFGSYDPVGEAEAKLEGLRMRDNHQATKYFIQFMQLASRVHWGEAALQRQAYKGLAERIKNDMVHHDKPKSLSGLRKLAQAIDARYWERRDEVSCETRVSSTSSHKPEHKLDTPKADKATPSSSAENPETPLDPKKSIPELLAILRKDGKLMPEERQRRFDKNLCMVCGASGHMAKDFPKASSASSKTHAAKTAKVPSEPSSSDS